MKSSAVGKFFHCGTNWRPGIHLIGRRNTAPLVLSDVVIIKATGNSSMIEPTRTISVTTLLHRTDRTLFRRRTSAKLSAWTRRRTVASIAFPSLRPWRFVMDPELGRLERQEGEEEHDHEEQPGQRVGVPHIAGVGKSVLEDRE